MFYYDWDLKKLVIAAFAYGGVFIPRLRTIRNYIIVGDLLNSCSILRFNKDDATIELLGRHPEEFQVASVETLYRNGNFGIVASDASRNVVVFGYTPRAEQGRVLPSKLSVECEFRVAGGSIAQLRRLRSVNVDPKTRRTSWMNQSKLAYITNYGEIGLLATLSDQENRTLQWLTRHLSMNIPHAAGLPPKQFKSLAQGDPRSSVRGKNQIVDAELLKCYFQLGLSHRKALATGAGTQYDRVATVIHSLFAEAVSF
jgi:cleavage and polyadenylation specificity factor subunit 1